LKSLTSKGRDYTSKLEQAHRLIVFNTNTFKNLVGFINRLIAPQMLWYFKLLDVLLSVRCTSCNQNGLIRYSSFASERCVDFRNGWL